MRGYGYLPSLLLRLGRAQTLGEALRAAAAAAAEVRLLEVSMYLLDGLLLLRSLRWAQRRWGCSGWGRGSGISRAYPATWTDLILWKA